MNISRRSFIRWVLMSGAAAACPFPVAAADDKKHPRVPNLLHSESNLVCHAVRDGESLPDPFPDERRGVVIVGGGPSGLAAADELKGADFILLEKEGHVGGNCYSEDWDGLAYSTAAAWDSMPTPEFQEIARRFRFDWKPIQGEDTVAYEGVWIRNFWNGRADNPAFEKLPYSASVKNGFRAFLNDIQHVDIEANKMALDAKPFSEFLEGYPPQLKAFWDAFGPSNWGARTEATSGYLGLQAAKDWFRGQRYTWEGGVGGATKNILAALPESARKNRLLTNAAAYRVRRQGKKVIVSFMQDGKARSIEASAVVMAAPKFIAKMLVEGLPADQFAAMSGMRYAPYLVYNLCFDRVVYNQGFDTYPIGAKHFADFIPADWVTHAEGGDLSRRQVVTVYAPLAEAERYDLQDDAKTLSRAQAAVDELIGYFPGWLDHLREVRIYRRGHPMPMSIPGYATVLQPAASRDFPPIYFAHCDSAGEVSDVFYAAINGIEAARKAATHL